MISLIDNLLLSQSHHDMIERMKWEKEMKHQIKLDFKIMFERYVSSVWIILVFAYAHSGPGVIVR